MLRFNLPSFLISLLLLAILVFIALYVRDGFVRPFLGDVLVVIWLFYFLRSFLRPSDNVLILITLLIAYCIEIAQYFKILTWLGLEHIAALRIVFGATFDFYDLLAYTLGAGALWVINRICMRQIIRQSAP